MTRIKSFARIAAVALAIAVIAVPRFAARRLGQLQNRRRHRRQLRRRLREQLAQRASFGLQLAGHRRQAARHSALHARLRPRPTTASRSRSSAIPGIGPELTLMDISTYPPVIVNAPGTGSPLNTTSAVPFNNVSIPGANVADTFTVTGTDKPVTRGVQQLAQFILRGPVTEVDAGHRAETDVHPGLDRRQRLPRLGHERHDGRPDAASPPSPPRTTRC